MENSAGKTKFLYIPVFVLVLVVGCTIFGTSLPCFADDTVSISITWASTGGYSLSSYTFKDLTTNTSVGSIPGGLTSERTLSYDLTIGHNFQVTARYSGRNSLGNSFTRYLVLYINGVACSTDSSSPSVVSDSDVITSSYSSSYNYYYFTVESSATPTPSPTPTPTPTVSPFPDITPFATPSENTQDVFTGASYNPLNVYYTQNGLTTGYEYTVSSYSLLYNNSEFMDHYFIYNNTSDINTLSYNTVDVTIPYTFYGWSGRSDLEGSPMFCSFKIALPEAYILPENASACLFLCNSENTNIAYIPLLKADYFNIFYCDNFSLSYTTFDHIKFEMLLSSSDSMTLGIDYFSISNFIISQDRVAWSDLAGEINDIINNGGHPGSSSGMLNWVDGVDSEVWDNATNVMTVINPYLPHNLIYELEQGLYVEFIQPGVRLYALMLEEFWETLGGPLQFVIILLVVFGALGSLAGIGANFYSKAKDSGGGKN